MTMYLSSLANSPDLNNNYLSGLNNYHNFLNSIEEKNDINIKEYEKYLRRFPFKFEKKI